jgi:phenylalanine-4-hydroxylase
MQQDYSKYTEEDVQVWTILYDKIMQILPNYATKDFLTGLSQVNFSNNRIPNFEETNQILNKITGWTVYAVPGLIENKGFFEHLSNREFPATTWLRKKSELEYLQEPDMFHDVFAHVPLLSNSDFAKFLEKLSDIALKHIENEWAVEIISRLYWYTVEFGLIREDGKLKVYGAGILSSSGETVYSIDSDIPQRVPFDIDELFQTPYIKDKFQEKYFIIDSYEQLFKSIPLIEQKLEEHLKKAN